MKRSIAIVGGGAAAVSFLYCYLQEIEKSRDLPKVVYMFEGRHPFGTGAAYDADCRTNLLNTKAGSASPFYDAADDFYRWLDARKEFWQKLYGFLPFDKDAYMPRPIFGMYLNDCLEEMVKVAASLGIEVVRIGALVTDARRSRNGYNLSAGYGLLLNTDYVFLCCGTLPAKTPSYLQKTSRFIPTPYPVESLVCKVPKHASVGVVGSRLSCIDAVIGMVEHGHTGKVVIHSRSGYFPCVRGTQGRIAPRLLSAESLERQSPRDLNALIDLFVREVALHGGEPVDFSLPLPPKNLEVYLRKEIARAGSDRLWQAVLYSTNGTIEKIWSNLDDRGKSEFMERYFSVFMAYRVSIPVENAEKILGYLESGQLEFCAGSFDIAVSDAGNVSVIMKRSDSAKFDYDYLINATGSPRDVRQVDSPLIESILEQGIAAPHRYGGIKIDLNSYQVTDDDGRTDAHLYALGELTNGAFFFTSALEIISRHTRLCVSRFAERLATTNTVSEAVSAA